MPEDSIDFVTQGNDKYAMLYRASQGWFDEGFYWFSKPYNPVGYEEEMQSGTGTQDEPDDGWEDTYAASSAEESILALFSNICTMAGGDYGVYCNLFRNVDQNIIDQYYNMQYRDITQFEHALPVIIAQNGGYAYATVVFYTVPSDYPDTDMDTYMISTIVGCDENGEWRVEYNEGTLSLLQDDYLHAIHTGGGYEARMSGMLFHLANICIP